MLRQCPIGYSCVIHLKLCICSLLNSSALRKDHGDPGTFYEAPSEAVSRLDPPSKAKSVVSFGAGGTLAWATSTGELLEIASCVRNKLVGAIFKRSIEGGDYDLARHDVLQRAINNPQGSGYGIGISLEIDLEPTEVAWMHNRWPRYTYAYRGLEIRLQYYIDSNSVVQQYQIRNESEEELSLPYIVSSDLCFHEHDSDDHNFHSIPTGKSPERTLLFQNSEVLIRSSVHDMHLRMACFLNGQRQSLWINKTSTFKAKTGVEAEEAEKEIDHDFNTSSTEPELVLREEIQKAEKKLVDAILHAKVWKTSLHYMYLSSFQAYYDRYGKWTPRSHKETNFAQHRNGLTIPRQSTQELCAIMQMPDSPQVKEALRVTLSTKSGIQSHLKSENDFESRTPKISEAKLRRNQYRIFRFKHIDLSNVRDRPRALELLESLLSLGEVHTGTSIGPCGYARYYFFTASLVAQVVHKENRFLVNEVRLKYATFLGKKGWHSDALMVLKDTSHSLSGKTKISEINSLFRKVQIRLGAAYLQEEKWREAEDAFQKVKIFRKESTASRRGSARLLERIAWTQTNQKRHEEAEKSYALLETQAFSQHWIVLSNLGFLKRRLGQVEEAKALYMRILDETSRECSKYVDRLSAQSGLFTCLCELGANSETIPRISGLLLKYIDVNVLLPQSRNHLSPFNSNRFSFTLARHLETLLSTCSISVQGAEGDAGMLLTDADPLNCAYKGRCA